MNVDGLKGVVAKMDYKSGRLYNWCYRVGGKELFDKYFS